VSREFHLITRERPSSQGLLDALRKVSGDTAEPELDGDFEDPNTYVNVSGSGLWREIEPPGHVEAAPGSAKAAWRVFEDLADTYDGIAIEASD
jgi:hypothetical protein